MLMPTQTSDHTFVFMGYSCKVLDLFHISAKTSPGTFLFVTFHFRKIEQ